MKAMDHIGICPKPLWVKYASLMIVWWLMLYPLQAKSRGNERRENQAADTAHIFEQLKNIPAQQRPAKAMLLYKTHYRKADEVSAMHHLDDLTNTARSLDDKQLECAVFEMRADYYSVNRGFNATSTLYYQKAIDFAAANNLTIDAGLYEHKKGMYYYTFKQNVDACKYFLQAQDIFKKTGYDKIPDISIYLAQQAGFYYDLGDYDNALMFLNNALKYPVSMIRVKINSINTIGLIYRNKQKFEQSLGYFYTALNLSKKNRDTAWIAITTGNIGSVFFLEQQYDKALPYIVTDYEISLKYGEKMNACFALLRLIKINLVHNNLIEAYRQLNQAELLIPQIRDPLRLHADFYDLKAQWYEQKGQLTESIAYRKKMEAAKDSLQQRNNIVAVERVKLSWEIANHQVQVNKIKNDAELGALRRNAIIMLLFFLTLTSLLVYNQRLLKAKKDKKILISEKQQVDEELKNAESELQVYTESLKKNNTVIEYFRKEIARLETQMVNKEDAELLEKMMRAHIMTDENWDEFKGLFAKAHTGFFTAIKKNYPGLSGTDIRILTLIKLQLSNREMANMLGITTDGIKKAKQRLRKKMNLSADMDIEQAIATL